jgi:excisionase family DNA binding protein
MKTLDLQQAAKFLNMHPVTVGEKARAGVIPGAKPGKCWTFIEDDLAAYLRSLYPSSRQALQGEHAEVKLCHSTNAKTRRSGGSGLPTTGDAYSKVLGLPTE